MKMPFFETAPRRAYRHVQGAPGYVAVTYIGADGPRGSGLRGYTIPAAEAKATFRPDRDKWVAGIGEAWDYVFQRGAFAPTLDDLLDATPAATLDDLLG